VHSSWYATMRNVLPNGFASHGGLAGSSPAAHNSENIIRTMPGASSGKTSCADRPRQGQGMSLDYCRPIVCANPDTGWIPFSAFRSSRQRGLSVPNGKPFSSAFMRGR
jgi:hypothetical protein